MRSSIRAQKSTLHRSDCSNGRRNQSCQSSCVEVEALPVGRSADQLGVGFPRSVDEAE